MKLAIETFTMVIVVTLACILFSSIISSNNQCLEARDFYNVIVNRIEDSDCNAQIISECENEAKEKGYKLKVEDITLYDESPSKLVQLTYNVKLPVFSMFGNDYTKQGLIEGYAR